MNLGVLCSIGELICSLSAISLFFSVVTLGCQPGTKVAATRNSVIKFDMGVVEGGEVAKYSNFLPETWGTGLKHIESSCECMAVQLQRKDSGGLLVTYTLDNRNEPDFSGSLLIDVCFGTEGRSEFTTQVAVHIIPASSRSPVPDVQNHSEEVVP